MAGAGTHQTVLFDVCDFQIQQMLTDVAGASAGPSYGAAIDVPGVSAFSGFDPNIVSAELKGDCRVIARKGRIDSVKAHFEYGKQSLDVLQALFSGRLFDAGTQSGLRLAAGAPTQYFKCTATITGVDVGLTNAQVVFYKATLTGGTFFDQTTDNFGQPKFDVEGIGIDSGQANAADPPTFFAGLMADILLNA